MDIHVKFSVSLDRAERELLKEAARPWRVLAEREMEPDEEQEESPDHPTEVQTLRWLDATLYDSTIRYIVFSPEKLDALQEAFSSLHRILLVERDEWDAVASRTAAKGRASDEESALLVCPKVAFRHLAMTRSRQARNAAEIALEMINSALAQIAEKRRFIRENVDKVAR